MITIIAILSLIDIVCTYAGISIGAIQEANPLIAYGFEWSIIGTCLIAILFISICLHILDKYRKQYKWVDGALYVIIIMKVIIVLMHTYWIINVI